MANKKIPASLAAGLRKKAEGKILANEDKSSAPLSPEETRQTLHELRVHQIELEMQNDELRRVQIELDASRARYFDLYDLAPVGYCTSSDRGLILETNRTLATLLGVARGALVKQPFSRFILPEDQDIYYLRRKMLLETGKPQAWDMRMLHADGAIFWAHLEVVPAQDADGAPEYRVVLNDITLRKQSEERIKSQLAELLRWQDVMLGREDRVQELKGEVNELCRRVGETARYPSQETGSADSATIEPEA